MDVASKIRSLFPAQDRIPPDVRLETPLRQDVYLVNGELWRWIGPMQDVLSPVCSGPCQYQQPMPTGPDIFPFAGRKDSAEGTLSVSDALRVFSIRTLVAAKAGGLNKNIVNTIVRERKSNFLSTDFIL
jgi:glyceraldehyde-3-phosphate dehydrogenase (NADP+)